MPELQATAGWQGGAAAKASTTRLMAVGFRARVLVAFENQSSWTNTSFLVGSAPNCGSGMLTQVPEPGLVHSRLVTVSMLIPFVSQRSGRPSPSVSCSTLKELGPEVRTGALPASWTMYRA